MTAPKLWSGFGLVTPLQARISGSIPEHVSGISIDTRTIEAGDLFFAIRGETSDGHDYVAAAFEKGAAAAVVDEAHYASVRGLGPLYVVKDTLAAMRGLGVAARARSEAKIVAVTGSVGKTGTKEALRLVLSGAGETHASAASYNNHWGVPLTLARMPESSRFGVFEIGMNHAGEIEPLTTMVRPHVAIITTVAPVHLEFFKSVSDIADAKAEIFSGLMPGGTAILNRDIDTYYRLATRAETSQAGHVLTFGEHPEADARLDQLTLDAEGSTIQATVHGMPLHFRLGAPGKHLAMNAMAVLLAAGALGIEPFFASLSLGRYMAGPGRGARTILQTGTGPFTLIDESYNANPASMRAAIALLGAAPLGEGGRRIAVLGDMRELGPNAPALHAALASDLVAQSVDLVFAAGPLTKPLYEAMPAQTRGLWVEQSAAIQAPLAAALRAGDVVMVKGSNGSRMGPLVAALKSQFGAASQSGDAPHTGDSPRPGEA
jgi:UDP-N-acetylmuramoyl-tripeptide--D-alanyl-D-alanine ligase